ncbi:MAG TPA: aminotransferase class V-fold PLP-dependent enzyme [Longimicrobium sp.]|nr:aminotransferase class V-fold PLP-dependent enzyme [Longimicrobium sp.]
MEDRSSSLDVPTVGPWRGILPARWEEVRPEDVEAYVRHLFSPGDAAMEDEYEMDARVGRLARELLRDPTTTSRGGLEGMDQAFGDTRVPQLPREAGDYLDYLEHEVVPDIMRVSSPRFIGHMTSALPYFVRPLMRLMTAMNQNVVKTETSKALTFYERQALARLHRLIYGLSDAFYDRHAQDAGSTLGIITSGGTLANVTALACARNRRLGPDGAFRGVERAGTAAALAHYGYRGAAVIGSVQMHYSFDKGMGLLGLGTDSLMRIPTGTDGSVDLQAVREAVEHCRRQKVLVLAIVGVAGSTDAGSVDDLEALAELAAREGIHYHVDAAWGGPTVFSDTHRPILRGIERADTVTFDGHKQLYLPQGIGMLFLRDPSLAAAIEKHAQYTARAGSADLGQRSLEGSRAAMSLLLHGALELLGQGGYEFLMDEGIRKARYLAQAVRGRDEFELLSEPRLNIVLYRFVPEEWRAEVRAGLLTPAGHRHIDAFNEKLQQVQSERGHTFISRTTSGATLYGADNPVVALRAVLANPLSTPDDIDHVLDDQVALARELAAAGAALG